MFHFKVTLELTAKESSPWLAQVSLGINFLRTMIKKGFMISPARFMKDVKNVGEGEKCTV
jgi:hypothetical protein